MKRCQIAWLALSWLAGCASEDPVAQPQSAPSTTAAAGSGAPPSAPAATLMSLIASFISDVNAQIELNCPCFVQMGAYKSVDECTMWQGSRPDWVPCTSAALAKFDSSETREMFSCLSNMVKDSTACLKTKACDPETRAECGGSPLQCVGEHIDIGLALFMECPDIALLTRQN